MHGYKFKVYDSTMYFIHIMFSLAKVNKENLNIMFVQIDYIHSALCIAQRHKFNVQLVDESGVNKYFYSRKT